MPCRVDIDNTETNELRAQFNELTALLCEAMQNVPNNAHISGALKTWWVKHQEEDERRRAIEAEQNELRRIASQTIDKLSPAQMEALKFVGVRFPNVNEDDE